MPTRKTRNTPLSSESVSSLSSQAHARTQTAEWCGQISCRRCRCSRCNGCALTFGTSRMAENETTAGGRLDTGRQGRQSACCRLYGTCQTDDKLELCHAYSPQATAGPLCIRVCSAVRWRPRHAARAAQNRHAGRAPKPRPRAHARRQRIPRRPCAATPADAQIPLTCDHPT